MLSEYRKDYYTQKPDGEAAEALQRLADDIDHNEELKEQYEVAVAMGTAITELRSADMNEIKLPAGTKIKFLKDIREGETVFRPAQIYAKEGELGEVVRPNELYGHNVKTYDSPKVFVASIGTEFEEVKEPTSPEFADTVIHFYDGKEFGTRKISGVRLPVGTKIRFLKDIIEEADGDHPTMLYAKEGELGEVSGHNRFEGHMVRSHVARANFGAILGDEFEEVIEPTSQEFADRQRWYNEGYNQALEDIKSNLAKLQEKR